MLAALRVSPGERATAADGLGPKRECGRVLLAAVEGERHALGLRMAADVLEDSGYESLYLGADVPTDALLRAADTFSPDLVALAATLPSLAPRLQAVAGEVRRAYPGLGLLVGGQAAPSRIGEATLIQDLELLSERMARPQV